MHPEHHQGKAIQLEKMIEAMDGPVYTVSDKERFMAELCSLVSLVIARPDDKGLKTRTSRIGAVVLMKMERGLKDGALFAVKALNILAEQLSSKQGALAFAIKLKETSAELQDANTRSQVSLKALGGKMTLLKVNGWKEPLNEMMHIEKLEEADSVVSNCNKVVASALVLNGLLAEVMPLLSSEDCWHVPTSCLPGCILCFVW